MEKCRQAASERGGETVRKTEAKVICDGIVYGIVFRDTRGGGLLGVAGEM